MFIYTLDYTHDLITRYQSLSHLPGFVLLESSDKQRGRYDIVTAYPYDSLKVLRNSSSIQGAFNQLQSMMPKASVFCDLPFQGGAIGYIAYDFGEMLAGLSSTPHPCNDMPLIDMRFYDWAIVADHHLKRVSLISANRVPETVDIVCEIKVLWEGSTRLYEPFKLQEAFMPLISKLDYEQAFRAIHQELTRGRSYQVNYTQPFLGRYSGEPWELYKRVRSTNPVPFSAFMRCSEGNILSFSPERFFLMDDGMVSTSPIKGTAHRSTDPLIDEELKSTLKACAKNQAENVMIVDLLRNDLSKFAKPGSVHVTTLCEVQSFKAVHHLVSHIEARYLDNVKPSQVFAACFPGGSITGAPKRESMRVINEQEPYSRGVYCGSIAYLSAHGRVDGNIAIRTITAKDDSLYLPAGGGIVIDSNWEDEYRECFTKIAAIVNELS